MPIYEYKCTTCKHQCELIQKFSDEPEKKCPHCGKDTLNRLISAPSFHLKGTGWYVTDFKDNDKKKSKKTTEKPVEKKEDEKKSTTTEPQKKDSKNKNSKQHETTNA